MRSQGVLDSPGKTWEGLGVFSAGRKLPRHKSRFGRISFVSLHQTEVVEGDRLTPQCRIIEWGGPKVYLLRMQQSAISIHFNVQDSVSQTFLGSDPTKIYISHQHTHTENTEMKQKLHNVVSPLLMRQAL